MTVGAPGWTPAQTVVSFRHRDYRLLWVATLPMALGFWMEQVALGWLVLQLSGSAFILGVAGAARMVPWFALGMVAGAMADRLDRRRLMLAVMALLVAAEVGIALLILLEAMTTPLAILLGMATGAGQAFLMTARQAYIADVVGPRGLTNGIALSQVAQRVAGVPGAFVGGSLIALLGMAGVFLVVAGGYAVAIALLLPLRTRPGGSLERETTLLRNVASGLRLIRENRVVTVLLFLAVATEIFGFSHNSIMPVLAESVLHAGPSGLGALMAARALGGLLGVLGLSALGDPPHKGKLLLLFCGAFGVSLASLALFPAFAAVFLILVAVGAMGGAFDTLQQTGLQLAVGEGQRGRAMGVWVLGLGVGPLGHLGVGGLAQTAGVLTAMAINGSILALIALGTAALSPRLRRL